MFEKPMLAWAESAAHVLLVEIEPAEPNPRLEIEPILAELPLVAKASAVVALQNLLLQPMFSRALWSVSQDWAIGYRMTNSGCPLGKTGSDYCHIDLVLDALYASCLALGE